ncbi:MAG: nitrous oxide reductase family maturation protein NosD [Bacillota bacterium]
MKHLLFALVFALLVLSALPDTAAAAGRRLVVTPEGPYRTIGEALAEAADGDEILVRGGRHSGPITIDRSVRLIGEGEPEIDGGGQGTVIYVTAPDVEIRYFRIHGTGESLDQEHAGIYAEAPRVRIIGNRFDDVLFGIYLKGAPESLIESNEITGKEIFVGLVGDGIRLWRSPDSIVRENTVRRTRQVIVQHSDETLVARNHLVDNQLGVHVMISHRVTVAENEISGSDAAIYGMYSRDLIVRRNEVTLSRGPSGYGLGLKDMDNILVEENRFVGNQEAIYLDNSPRRGGDDSNLFRRNLFARNDRALLFQPSVVNNIFTENSFVDNVQQLKVLGGGEPDGNHWSQAGRGNYWSDYAGYDETGDGVGDLPYQPRSLYESLADRHPVLNWFVASPAVSAVEMAARVFPTLAGPPRITDGAPLIDPPVPLHENPPARGGSGLPAVPLALLGGAAGLLAPGLIRWGRGQQQ